MNNSVAIFEKFGLINANVSYSEIANALLTTGYTSDAGNFYFNSIRVAEGIVIKADKGIGYAYTFLNGFRIYSIKDNTLIADKTFRETVYYSVARYKVEVKKMLLKVLEEAAVKEGYSFDYVHAATLIEKILTKAFDSNQVAMLRQQTQKYLSAS